MAGYDEGRERGDRTARRPLASGAALVAGLVLEAGAVPPGSGVQAASIAPGWVESHRPFTMALSFESGNCAPEFSHKEARLVGGKLVLSALDEQNPAVRCSDTGPWPFRTEFTVPALDSGEYPVQVRWNVPCEFSPTPCPSAWNPQDAGTLRVTDSARLAYRIAPRSAPAGKAFTLLLTGDFRCGYKVIRQSVDATARPSLALDLTLDQGSGACDTLVRGIEYEVPPLAAGVWQVYVRSAPYCPPGVACPLTLTMGLAGALAIEASADAIVPWRREFRPAPAIQGAGFRAGWDGAFRDAAGRRAKPASSGATP